MIQSPVHINPKDLEQINRMMADPDNPLVEDLAELIHRFGGAEAINEKAAKAGAPDSLRDRLKTMNSPYLADIEWLESQRDRGAFVSLDEYCHQVLKESGSSRKETDLDKAHAVTLEISALQFFPWLMVQARQAIAKKELMPGRFIRVRNMAEQARDNGDILATALAMKIMGASHVESLDTRGTDGSNIHLAGGPATITGFFGGIGQPNRYPLKWAEEFLLYYTEYGIREVLNINSGTVLLGYLMHRLGVDIQFKISVFVGNDNPYFILWTLMTARLFAREDGTTPLSGFNLSNSVDNETIRTASTIRRILGLEHQVRFEHHITEAYKSIVGQPYNRRKELVEIASQVPNISAKHEGGDPEVEESRDRPSDIFDYFLSKPDILTEGLMDSLCANYLDKHGALNRTARELIRAGIGVIPAPLLHSSNS